MVSAEKCVVPADKSAPMKHESQRERFERIAAHHVDVAFRVARRSGVPRSHVDDVIQEAFLVVGKRLHDVALHSERAFVAAVTVRVAANWRRAEARRGEALQRLPDAWSEDESGLPDMGAQRSQGLALLDQALATMTEQQREVFILTELEQLTAREIAEALHLAEAAVVSRLRRSREVFQRFCEDWQRDEPRLSTPHSSSRYHA